MKVSNPISRSSMENPVPICEFSVKDAKKISGSPLKDLKIKIEQDNDDKEAVK